MEKIVEEILLGKVRNILENLLEEILLGKVILVKWHQKCNSFPTIGELLGNCSIPIHNSEKQGKVVQMLTNVLCVIKIPKILTGRKLQVVVLFDKWSATILWF